MELLLLRLFLPVMLMGTLVFGNTLYFPQFYCKYTGNEGSWWSNTKDFPRQMTSGKNGHLVSKAQRMGVSRNSPWHPSTNETILPKLQKNSIVKKILYLVSTTVPFFIQPSMRGEIAPWLRPYSSQAYNLDLPHTPEISSIPEPVVGNRRWCSGPTKKSSFSQHASQQRPVDKIYSTVLGLRQPLVFPSTTFTQKIPDYIGRNQFPSTPQPQDSICASWLSQPVCPNNLLTMQVYTPPENPFSNHLPHSRKTIYWDFLQSNPFLLTYYYNPRTISQAMSQLYQPSLQFPKVITDLQEVTSPLIVKPRHIVNNNDFKMPKEIQLTKNFMKKLKSQFSRKKTNEFQITTPAVKNNQTSTKMWMKIRVNSKQIKTSPNQKSPIKERVSSETPLNSEGSTVIPDKLPSKKLKTKIYSTEIENTTSSLDSLIKNENSTLVVPIIETQQAENMNLAQTTEA